jgi:hypothetical protein
MRPAKLARPAHDDDGRQLPLEPPLNLPHQMPAVWRQFRQSAPFPPGILAAQVLHQLGGQGHLRKQKLCAHAPAG